MALCWTHLIIALNRCNRLAFSKVVSMPVERKLSYCCQHFRASTGLTGVVQANNHVSARKNLLNAFSGVRCKHLHNHSSSCSVALRTWTMHSRCCSYPAWLLNCFYHTGDGSSQQMSDKSSSTSKYVHNSRVVSLSQSDKYCQKWSLFRVVRQLREDMILTVPNMLTFSRMLMTPFLGYLVVSESYTSACIVFTVAGVTDLLDGLIARNFANQTSALGSFIDPFADKLLVCVLYITLTCVHLLPLALTAMVIARDVCLMAAGFYVRYISLPSPRSLRRYFDLTNPSAKLKPLAVSKLNTAVQLSLVAGTLAAPVFGFVDHPALHALWYLTGATTVVSGVGYMFAKDTFTLLKQRRQ